MDQNQERIKHYRFRHILIKLEQKRKLYLKTFFGSDERLPSILATTRKFETRNAYILANRRAQKYDSFCFQMSAFS